MSAGFSSISKDRTFPDLKVSCFGVSDRQEADFDDLSLAEASPLGTLTAQTELSVSLADLPLRLKLRGLSLRDIAKREPDDFFSPDGTSLLVALNPKGEEGKPAPLYYRLLPLGFKELYWRTPSDTVRIEISGSTLKLSLGERARRENEIYEVQSLSSHPGPYLGISSDLCAPLAEGSSPCVVPQPVSSIMERLMSLRLAPQVMLALCTSHGVSFEEHLWPHGGRLSEFRHLGAKWRFYSVSASSEEGVQRFQAEFFRGGAIFSDVCEGFTYEREKNCRRYRGPFPVLDVIPSVDAGSQSRSPHFTFIVTDEFAREINRVHNGPLPLCRFIGQSDALKDGHLAKKLTVQSGESIRTPTSERKLLILDGDNTLWDGIIDEVGVEGLRIGPERAAFLQSIASLREKGVILALCSVNEVQDVEAALRALNHPLKDKFAAVCGVRFKAPAIKEILRNLGYDPGAAVFLDDSQAEQGAVLTLLPQILVPKLPEEVSRWRDCIESLDVFAVSEPGQAATRTKFYDSQDARRDLEEQAASHIEFLRHLHLVGSVSPATAAHAARISELSFRTNQFNLTGLRLSLPEVRSRLESPDYAAYVMTLQDRFGDYGVVSAVMVKLERERADFELFDLSCRAINRSAAAAFLREVLSDLKNKGLKTAYAHFVPSPRNGQFAEFYSQMGFTMTGSTPSRLSWSLDLGAFDPKTLQSLVRIEKKRHRK